MYNKYITQIFYAKHVLYVGYTWDIRGIYVGYMRVLCSVGTLSSRFSFRFLDLFILSTAFLLS